MDEVSNDTRKREPVKPETVLQIAAREKWAAEYLRSEAARLAAETAEQRAAREARTEKMLAEHREREAAKAALPARIHKHFESAGDLQRWILSHNGQKNYVPVKSVERMTEKYLSGPRKGETKIGKDGQPIYLKDSHGQHISCPVIDPLTGKQAVHYAWGFQNDWDKTSQGIEMLRTGDTAGLDEAQEFVRRFNESVERPTRSWQQSVAGAFPNVPGFLAGEPEHMWNLQADISDKTPIRIWVGVTTSLVVPDELIRRRGVILVALMLAISERRPVFLTPYTVITDDEGRASIVSWDLTASPFVYSELASLTNSLITRYAGLYANTLLNPNLQGMRLATNLHQEDAKKLMGFRKGDLLIPSGANSWQAWLNDPFAWISERLKEVWGDEELE